MKTQFSNGDAVDVPAPAGGSVSGNGYLIGSLFGIWAVTNPINVLTALWTRGVFTVTKVSAQAWAVGSLIYWDDTAKNFTTVVGTNKIVGVAVAVAANPTATGVVRLNGAAIS